jgi:hypothetical protein
MPTLYICISKRTTRATHGASSYIFPRFFSLCVTRFVLRFIDFGNAQEECLIELAAACQKATFGLDQTDVLDETYRKAGKLDLDQFSAQLDVVGSGLMDAIAPDILDGQDADADTALVAELYKLNVYGPFPTVLT